MKIRLRYVTVLADMADELNKIDPKLAANSLVNPPADYLNKLKTWAALTDEQTQQFNAAYAAITGG
jgi:spermidine/putrescine transport system substrate-binding protein